MGFSIKKPCKNCPFLKASVQPQNVGWLGKERAQEIIDSMVVHDSIFPCHKTTEEDEDGLDVLITSTTQHCAGALALQHKEGFANQMTRIAMRLNIYNPDELQNFEDVVDSKHEFIGMHGSKKGNP